MIYSTCSYLLSELRKLIPPLKSEIIPGITSFQTAAAKSQEPLVEDRETLTIIPSFSSEALKDLPASRLESGQNRRPSINVKRSRSVARIPSKP